MAADVARFFQISAEGGHAGPGSTWDYVHQIEEPMAYWSQQARPESWRVPAPHELDLALFPDIGLGMLLPARTAPPKRPGEAGTPNVVLMQPFDLCTQVTQRLVRDEDIDEIAGRCVQSPEAVLLVLNSIVKSLADAGLSDQDTQTTTSRQAFEVWRHRTWIAAASHPKLAPVARRFATLLAANEGEPVTAVWHAWIRCVQGGHLNLDRARPASALIRFLLEAGVPRSALAVTAAPSSLPLPPHLAIHKLSWRESAPRAGAPRFRLALVDKRVTARDGRARQVSVKGLNWLFVLAGAVLLMREK